MIGNDPLDPRLAKVIALWRSANIPGEKAAAQARAETMAAAAGMTLDEAIAAADAPAPAMMNLFAGFDDWCEEREPGYKARRAAEKAETERQRLERRAAILARFGSEEAALAPCERELRLHRALARWRRPCEPPWQRWTYSIEGCSNLTLHNEIPDAIRAALASADPVPTNFAAAKAEMDYWHARRQDLEDVLGPGNYGDSGLDLTAELRLEMLRPLVEHELRTETLRDLRDRLRYFDDLDIMDKGDIVAALLRDVDALVAAQEAHPSNLSNASPAAHPSNDSETHGQIRAALDADPSRSDRDIARAFGCSPTTVGKVRRTMGLASSVRSVQRGGRTYQATFDFAGGRP